MQTSRRFLIGAVLFVATLVSWTAYGAASLSVSPSGPLPNVANVPIIITLSNPEGLQITGFTVKLNSQDVSSAFGQLARLSASGTTTIARVEYLFAPGQWQVDATIRLRNPTTSEITELVTTSSFTVPGDAQERRKETLLSRISAYLSQFDGYIFNSFVSLGDLSKFQNRLYASDVEVYLDPAYLARPEGSSSAAYVEDYWWSHVIPIYVHDLILPVEPENYAVNGSPYRSQTLWHEMVHAISHGVQLESGNAPLPLDDHAYLGRAEACIRIGLTDNLTAFDAFVRQNGKNPTADVAAQIRPRWRAVNRACSDATSSSYQEFGYPTDAQMDGFRTLTGIDVSPNTIMQGYLSQGYSPLYFADMQVVITSPLSGIEINENQLQVEASFTNNEPGLTVDRVGFSINGAIQESARAGNQFGTTAVLRTGDNTITALVVTTDGQLFQSAPITIKSNALNNTYHVRITWDRSDTDVDLHFSWSGGAECYWANPTPAWGSAATSPRLDVDDTDGYGPENITIGALPGTGTYTLSVHYFSDHGNGPTTVFASIYTNGVAVFSDARTMSDGDSWTLYQFTIP